VRAFRQELSLEDAIEFHAFAWLEASMRVTNGIPLGCPLLLPVGAVNYVETLKAPTRHWLHHVGLRTAVHTVLQVSERLMRRHAMEVEADVHTSGSGGSGSGSGGGLGVGKCQTLIRFTEMFEGGGSEAFDLPILPPEMWIAVMAFFVRSTWAV
jgi:hypothetical protein